MDWNSSSLPIGSSVDYICISANYLLNGNLHLQLRCNDYGVIEPEITGPLQCTTGKPQVL